MTEDYLSYSFYYIKDNKISSDMDYGFKETDREIMTSTVRALQRINLQEYLNTREYSKLVNKPLISSKKMKTLKRVFPEYFL